MSLAGCIGQDGKVFLDKCRQVGIDTQYLHSIDVPTGSAVIQVNQQGENCILLYGGANQAVTRQQIDQVLAAFQPGDVLMAQNEISQLAYLIEEAAERGMRIALNPSPMDRDITSEMLRHVSWLFVNEVESEQLCGSGKPEQWLAQLCRLCPAGEVILTLGKEGAYYSSANVTLHQNAFCVHAVDTTAAGDTFTGYFLAAILQTGDPAQALYTASKAAAIAVTRKGAYDSIPTRQEVENTALGG